MGSSMRPYPPSLDEGHCSSVGSVAYTLGPEFNPSTHVKARYGRVVACACHPSNGGVDDRWLASLS